MTKTVPLGELVKIKTGKLDANASIRDGIYPFFTCSQKPLRIDKFSYDCECVLVAGNGDLNVKYFEGKFDAYQRTYILEARKEDQLSIKYLYHFMSLYVSQLRKEAIGGVIKYIKLNNLTDVVFPLPSLDEQRRIATLLDRADALRQKDHQLLAHYDQLAQSLFLDLFGDPVRNEKGWEVKKIIEVCSKVTDGVHAKPDYTDNGVPFISVKNITSGNLVFDNCKFISEKDHDIFYKRCNPQIGDILYTKVGATYGRAALVDTNEQFSLYVSVALLKPKSEKVNSLYLKSLLNSNFIKRQADEKIKGIGVPDLHLVEIKSFEFPLPPLHLQNHFATLIEQIEKQKAVVRQQMAASEALFGRLLQESFG